MKVKEYDGLGYRIKIIVRNELPFPSVIFFRDSPTCPCLSYFNGKISFDFSEIPEMSDLKWIERIFNDLKNAIELKKWFEANLEEIFRFDD